MESSNVIDFLSKKKVWECPMCHKKQLLVSGSSCQIVSLDQKLLFPVTPVVCDECGNTLLINTIVVRDSYTHHNRRKHAE